MLHEIFQTIESRLWQPIISPFGVLLDLFRMTKIQNYTYLACHMERLAKETSSSTKSLPLLQCAAHAASPNMIKQA